MSVRGHRWGYPTFVALVAFRSDVARNGQPGVSFIAFGTRLALLAFTLLAGFALEGGQW